MLLSPYAINSIFKDLSTAQVPGTVTVGQSAFDIAICDFKYVVS
jgi:hypothetical protein